MKINFRFKRNTVLLLVPFTFLNIAELPAQKIEDTLKTSIERLRPELDAIISKDAKVEMIGHGFQWTEGPVWVESGKMLLFSDIPENSIYKWTAGKGTEIYLKPSGYTGSTPRSEEMGSNGLALDQQGRLVLCQHGDRRVAVMDAPLKKPQPNFTTLAATYEGKKFNSPNDLVIKSNGDIYFTDPPYGLEKNMDDPAKELTYQGVFRISKDGSVTLLTDTLTRPNGIAFSADEKKLLIGNSDPLKPHLYIYDVDANGLLKDGKIFFNGAAAFEKENRAPDGLKVDNKGNIFTTGPGGIWILNSDGRVLGRIKINLIISNCAFSNDYKTLFITADDYLLKVNLR